MTTRIVGALMVLFSLGCLLLAGCGTEPAATTGSGSAGVDDLGPHQLDAHRTLGEPIHADNLTVWPVYTDTPIDIGEFLTLQEAQERKVAVIRELGGTAAEGQQGQQQIEAPTPTQEGAPARDDEPAQEAAPAQEDAPQAGVQQEVGVGAQAAEVGRVVIENQGELPILVVAGTIIDGGKQDRQIGQDFVIAAGATVDVDAFCVEHGRWGADTVQTGVRGDPQGVEVVDGAAPVQIAYFRASKSAGIAPKLVRSAGQYEKDQGKVWKEVASSNAALKTENATQTLMGAVEEADAATQAKRAAYEKTIADAFAALAQREQAPVGFAYAVNGKPVTVRAFAHARILRSQLPLFLKAMAIEAHMGAEAKTADAKATAADVIAMVRGIQAAREAEVVTTRASNENVYRRNDVGFNGRCRIPKRMLRHFGVSVGPDKVVITEDWTAK